MKARPILFSAPMVRAILEGRKTQTRRVVKPQPVDPFTGRDLSAGARPDSLPHCPYGQPGDHLWVRETWQPERHNQCERITYAADGGVAFVDDSDVPRNWRRPKAARTGNITPLYMPRWASRITLEVTGVRVERLQDITEEDARAEGVEADDIGKVGLPCYSARQNFERLWESINGAGSWAANPWVWVVEFRRVGS